MIKPLANRVLIKASKQEEKTQSGIYIPDTAKEKPRKGEIIALGNKMEEKRLKVGDKVLFGKYAGTEISHKGVDYLMMREDDVFAIL